MAVWEAGPGRCWRCAPSLVETSARGLERSERVSEVNEKCEPQPRKNKSWRQPPRAHALASLETSCARPSDSASMPELEAHGQPCGSLERSERLSETVRNTNQSREKNNHHGVSPRALTLSIRSRPRAQDPGIAFPCPNKAQAAPRNSTRKKGNGAPATSF
jgi:hypothetical protein